MKNTQFTDKDLVEMIRSGGFLRLEALKYIYKDSGWVSTLTNILRKNSVQESDIKDAVQEAMVVLDNHVRNIQFKEKGSLKNFFIGICKGRIYSNNRSIKRHIFKENQEDLDNIELITPEVNMLQEEQKKIISEILNKMGEPCKTVLTLYQLSYSMQEIGKAIGKSEGMAKKMNFNCRNKMRALISQNPYYQRYLNH